MAEVTKYSVYDPRIVQTKPKYAVEKGALSITNVSFQAQTADSSSVQFNIQVPSENVFVDRAVQWAATQCAVVTVELQNVGAIGTIPAGTSLQGLLAPAAFPLHQSVSQMSATINDATVTVNTQDVLPQILRLADLADARRQRTCPTMLDKYLAYPDSRVVQNSPLLQWDQTKASSEVPNGGFNGFYYATSGTGATPCSNQSVGNVQYVNGQPTLATNLTVAQGTRTLTFYVVWASVEKLLLPPFIFADQDELSTGLFGVQNFQVQMNMAPTPIRSVRVSENFTILASSSAADWIGTITPGSTTAVWSTTAAFANPFVTKPSLAVQFLTPALDIPLPPKSIVPYMEFPRYISSPGTPVVHSTVYSINGTSVQSQTITLPNIPDLLVIYAKPASYGSSAICDYSLPVLSISVNFDNFSGLLANHTQEELYKMSVDNGLDMDWNEWSGFGAVPLSLPASGAGPGGNVALVGGPLVLRPGRDFALSAGQAPGLVGNFTLQYNLTLQNYSGADITPNIYTIPISSGFFETIKGSSRIIKGVLTEQDILSAPSHAPEADLERLVGAARHGHHGGAHGGAHHGGAHGGRHGGRHGGAKAAAMKAYM